MSTFTSFEIDLMADLSRMKLRAEAAEKELSTLRAKLEATEKERLELLQLLSDETTAKFAFKERAQSAEQRIRESQEQEPFGYWFEQEVRYCSLREADQYFDDAENKLLLAPLYTSPIIPPDVAELQREKEELQHKLAEYQLELITRDLK